jgi:hypothetical protein
MNIFLTQKVTAHVGIEHRRLERTFSKSHGAIIDNLSDYSENKKEHMERTMGGSDIKLERYIRVPQEFLNKFPELSLEKAEKHYNTYLSTIRKYLLRRLPYTTENYIHLSLKRMGDEMSDFQYKNNRYYIWKEFKDIRPFFYAPEDKKGNGYKKGNPFELNSEVYMFNQKLIDLLIDTVEVNQLVSLYYGDLTPEMIDALEIVPIDMISLENFINNTTREIENTDKNSKYQAILYRNLRQAKYVKIISSFFYSAYNQYVLPQIPKPSPYGRVYYKGINIQNMTKEVRVACLGEHYVYDLNAAIYSIKLMMVKKILKDSNIDDFGHFTYTKEYLDWKSPLRKQLAKHITAFYNGEKLVKDAITAIGFGARIGGGSWLVDGEWHTTSIEDIIMNPIDRSNFMNDPWIKKFVKEQQTMTKIIANDFIETPSFVESVINVPNMFKNNTIRKSQVMSYAFQHTEKMIMDMITENIPVIARVHDSFITKKKLSSDQLTNIKYILNQLDDRMTIGCEEFHSWIDVEKFDDESDIDEAFSRLTGVPHVKPVIKLKHQYQPKQIEGSYDSTCDYGQREYDPENDPYIQDMNEQERREHYRIVGYMPTSNIPKDILDIMTK